MRKFLAFVLIPLVLQAACGGGGGGGGTTTTMPTGPTTPPMQSLATAGPPNVESMTIDVGPAGLTKPAVNTPYISVTVCIPNTQTCQTIDHIEIDTGSIGLRLISSAVTVALPAEGDGSGNNLAECLMFADGTASYGSVNVADITLPVSGETAAAVNVQVIGATTVGTATNPSCTGTASNTVASFGANGILGVGPFTNDCNSVSDCTAGGGSAIYYSCPTGGGNCNGFNASVTQQLPNPVTLFAKDNNGVIVELPAISASGAASPTGAVIVFGIGTESNNGLGSAVKLNADPNTGEIGATLNGTTLSNGYMDSGSNANFFTDSSLTTCPANTTTNGSTFYCPASTTAETATLSSADGATPVTADFEVANAATLFANATFTAFDDLGATAFTGSTGSLDLGLPFFYGHNIFLAIESASNATPYFAIASN